VPFTSHAENMAAVLNGEYKELLCDGKEGRKSIQVLTAVYRSAKEHREVKL
jgi:predicted dehydrogenase